MDGRQFYLHVRGLLKPWKEHTLTLWKNHSMGKLSNHSMNFTY